MLQFRSKARGVADIKQHVDNNNKLIALIDAIKPIVKKWDGKVINKRFENELRNCTGCYIMVRISYQRLEIETLGINWYDTDPVRRKMMPIGFAGERGHFFIMDNAWVDGAKVPECCYTVTRRTETGKHRIVASEMLSALDARKEQLKKKNEELEASQCKVDEVRQALTLIDETLQKINKMPWEVRKAFDLDYSLRRR